MAPGRGVAPLPKGATCRGRLWCGFNFERRRGGCWRPALECRSPKADAGERREAGADLVLGWQHETEPQVRPGCAGGCTIMPVHELARLTPFENGLGDVCGEWCLWRAASSANGTPSRCTGIALNRRPPTSSLINRGSGFATANGWVPSISILISMPARRSRAGTNRTDRDPRLKLTKLLSKWEKYLTINIVE